jgi:ankyrin repeat protein
MLPVNEASAPNQKNIDLLLNKTLKDINIRDKETERTLLHCAAATSCGKEIIEKILERGGDILAEDKDGKLPLQLAIDGESSKFEKTDFFTCVHIFHFSRKGTVTRDF